MTDLVLVVPTRERPKAATEFAECFTATRQADTELLFAVDDTDPVRAEYEMLASVWPHVHIGVMKGSTSMVFALNGAAKYVIEGWHPFAVGFAGDDHRLRTPGWDTEYVKALREMGTGIVYGDDLFQGEKLPTQCAMTVDIIEALGYMAPPTLRHLYVDTWWKALGEGAGCLRYLPQVIIEHMHPIAGKAEWDAGHARVNSPGMYRVDKGEFMRLVRDTELLRAVEAVKALCGSD